jgi:hypothetical protein
MILIDLFTVELSTAGTAKSVAQSKIELVSTPLLHKTGIF